MTAQTSLSFARDPLAELERGPHDAAARLFYESNPRAVGKLVQFAREAMAVGHVRLGIGELFERVRWWSKVETTLEEYKLNNNHRAYVARRLMHDYPEFRGLFEVRS